MEKNIFNLCVFEPCAALQKCNPCVKQEVGVLPINFIEWKKELCDDKIQLCPSVVVTYFSTKKHLNALAFLYKESAPTLILK